MLHIVNKSIFEKNSLLSCFKTSLPKCSILLIENAVLSATQNNAFSAIIQQQAVNKRIFLLEPDLKARGFVASDLIAGVTPVDYSGFVDLVAESKSVHSWM